jgi:uncharacterized membrane protein HdeD (DUF308 family)
MFDKSKGNAMSAGNSGPNTSAPKPGSTPDPAYQGAKPATFPEGGVGPDFFGILGTLRPSNAMSALLAQNWWAVALRGALAILFGIVAILLPGVTLAALVLLFAAYMLVDGILDIIAGLRAARRHERWGALVLEGIIDLVAGVIAFFLPLITIVAFVYLMGAWAIVSGVVLGAAAFRLNLAHGRWLMGIGGAVSVIWGFLLITQPLIGAVALAWWMGGYALFFGVALLVLAFRLRRLRAELPRTDAIPHSV